MPNVVIYSLSTEYLARADGEDRESITLSLELLTVKPAHCVPAVSGSAIERR